MLAFSIALLLDMPRPYWAMASVYITSNQLTGATYSKAVYRILGTLIGAAGTIVLVPNLVNAPELLSLGIALWVGICLYLSLIDGTPRSYVFMLAGYTVALLGFPIVSVPQSAFDIVVARVQEITLGIICASVVAMVVLPRSVASAVTTQADAWLAAARRLGMNVLTGHGSDQDRDNERIRLASAASEIDQLGRHVGYEVAASTNIAQGLQRLRQHMLSLLPLLGSIEDRKLALNSNGEVSARVAAICTRIARWLEEGGRDGQEAGALRAALDEVQPALDVDAGWTDITVAGLVIRLRNLVDVMHDCRLLREAIADGRNPEQLPLVFRPDTLTIAVPHRDHGSALLAAASVALAVLACCAFPIATGWPDGVAAPLFAAVVGSLLAGVDDPLPTFRNFYGLFLIVIAVHGIYLFGVLPRITAFEMLIAALMPTFVLFGWMAARPATARVGAMLAIYLSVQLALTDTYSADFSSYANSSVALMFGVALTGVICGIVRLLGAGWIASRLLRSNWTTLAAVAERRSDQDRFATCQSHAASPRSACRAYHRGSCRGKERRRQSSPASNGAKHSRRQAGWPWPVPARESGNRSIPRPSCPDLQDPHGRPASRWLGGTARRHDRIYVAGVLGRGARSGAHGPRRRSHLRAAWPMPWCPRASFAKGHMKRGRTLEAARGLICYDQKADA